MLESLNRRNNVSFHNLICVELFSLQEGGEWGYLYPLIRAIILAKSGAIMFKTVE